MQYEYFASTLQICFILKIQPEEKVMTQYYVAQINKDIICTSSLSKQVVFQATYFQMTAKRREIELVSIFWLELKVYYRHKRTQHAQRESRSARFEYWQTADIPLCICRKRAGKICQSECLLAGRSTGGRPTRNQERKFSFLRMIHNE